MRDKGFVALHRGGELTKENHRRLMNWARLCAENVLSLIEGEVDQRLTEALLIAKKWEEDQVATGEAMKASVAAHAVARENADPVNIAVARAIGQAVATAHMADHSLGGALYALKAVNQAGKSVEKERAWQLAQLQKLTGEIVELVLATWKVKEKSFKL